MKPVLSAPQRDAAMYLSIQLERAHSRHDLVEGLRIRAFHTLLAFHALLAGAVVLGSDETAAMRSNLDILAWGLPLLALAVSFALFASFVRWTTYMYAAKTWIRNVEGQLASRFFPQLESREWDHQHAGTYYLDHNDGYGPLDIVTRLLVVTMIAVSASGVAALAYLVKPSFGGAGTFGLAVAAFQTISLVSLKPKTRKGRDVEQVVPPDAREPPSADTRG